jgi:hypothetical protein
MPFFTSGRATSDPPAMDTASHDLLDRSGLPVDRPKPWRKPLVLLVAVILFVEWFGVPTLRQVPAARGTGQQPVLFLVRLETSIFVHAWNALEHRFNAEEARRD